MADAAILGGGGLLYDIFEAADQFTVTFPIPPKTTKQQIDVTFTKTTIKAGLKGSTPLVEGSLFGTIDAYGSYWQIEGQIITLHVEKKTHDFWHIFIIGPRDSNINNIDPQSQYGVGMLLEEGTLGMRLPRNLGAAFENFKASAEKGFPQAQLKLGLIYQSGKQYGYPVEQNPEQAVRWLEKASEVGNPIAKLQLALSYQLGLGGIAINYRKAEEWYLLMDTKEALYRLGQLYETDRSKEEDHWEANPGKAIKAFQEAANMGSPDACFRLGTCYFEGLLGLDVNLEEAKKQFDRGLRWLDPEEGMEVPPEVTQKITALEEKLKAEREEKRRKKERADKIKGLLPWAVGAGVVAAFMLHRYASKD